MMTAAAKKRKANPQVQSTDRGGILFLPLGVVFISLGFMMLLGTMLQTASSSLVFFKNMAIGLGGGLYPFIPVFSIWLGLLLCVSSKRFVSFYGFMISFLLFICAGAFITLAVPIHPSLGSTITYLNNHIDPGSRPDSWGQYLGKAYMLKASMANAGSFLPGGGALGMLLAFPVWSVLGDLFGSALMAFAFVILFFALIRLNPFRIADRIRRYKEEKIPVSAALMAENGYVPTKPAPAQAAAVLASEGLQADPASQGSGSPAQTSFMPGAFSVPTDSDQDPFIAQPPATLWINPHQQEQVPEPSAQNAWKTVPAAPPEQPGLGAVYQAVFPDTPGIGKAPAPAAANMQETASPADTNPARPIRTPEPAVKRTASLNNEKPIHVHTAPAVPLSGERVSVPRRGQMPDEVRGLDGTPLRPVPRQTRLAIDDYTPPPVRLLTEPPTPDRADTTEEDRARADKLMQTLKNFSITAFLHDITHGPSVTRFAIRLAEGVYVSRLRSVMDNLAIELKAKGEIRAEIPIPGTSFVGLEVSNDKPTIVYLGEVLASRRLQESKSPTCVAIGRDITGVPITCELMDMPHLLIAGATGSGKSVCINSIICSMLYRASPSQVRLILIDPKFVELQPYNDVPHLLVPVITDAKKATAALDWVCHEMEQRYQTLQKAGVRNLDAYNRKLPPDEVPLPRIVLIVDEMSDLMTTSRKQIEDHIKRITQMARAAGICLILATQRPSVNVITGVIKANIPGRIAFRVSSPFDSKTILDAQGAEKLLGNGDMLYRSTTREPVRVQGCFVSDRDVEQTVEFIKSRNKAEYSIDLIEHIEQDSQPENGILQDSGDTPDGEFDELLPQAIEMAVESGQMSISMLQRVLRIGYARSGRLIDEMARRGIISGNEGTKARKALMNREQYSAYLEQGN